MESFNGRGEQDFSPSCSWILWTKPAKPLSVEKTLLCPSAKGNVGSFISSLAGSTVPVPTLLHPGNV